MIIAAYNEEAVIQQKVIDTLQNGYPPELIEVIVASDGSSDRTEEIVRQMEHPQVLLLALPRQGKAFTLNEAVRHAEGEILVFTDADALLEPDSILRLVENFADPEVGGVSGRRAHRIVGAGASGSGEGLYLQFDEWQKHLESSFGSTVASVGSLHALRHELYVPITDPTIADDMAISMPVVLQGYRLLHEPGAVAHNTLSADPSSNFNRRVRIANQAMRSLFYLGSSLWTSGFYSVQLISHKMLRYFVPLFLLLMLGSNIVLALESPFWGGLLFAQFLFYGLAAMGLLLHKKRFVRHRFLLVPYHFCLLNVAALAALVSLLQGAGSGTWAPRGGFQST